MTSWQWTCAAPVIDDIRTPDEVKDQKREFLQETFSTKGWFWSEMMIWVTYMAGNFWPFGYTYQLGFYSMFYIYQIYKSFDLLSEYYYLDGADNDF